MTGLMLNRGKAAESLAGETLRYPLLLGRRLDPTESLVGGQSPKRGKRDSELGLRETGGKAARLGAEVCALL